MFSHRLKQLREYLGLTQDELAKQLNLTQSTISYYESGRKMPTLQNAIIIAKLLNTSLDYLVGISNFQDYKWIKENEDNYCSAFPLDDIYNLTTSSLKDLENFISFLKFKEKNINYPENNNQPK
ncbi:helix-turn-helix domain-containing protein [Clostridiisalibacter paucivorans]|uniref:helix-turn-helix domain-containing protein n=1 Tax=Clostridiisalibacter paucivorans TaxID=408753 RepID=UPI000687C697|nr:helix-turn-helix transcriptional regulator [Clostridiisalibacter paucivorans]